ncbi:hypothetical protein GCM10009069_05720 [Algimonas arctica]|uniref:Glycosyltransferase 2-like domain-containing protein n=1 Tax=Algimonas arctica TaxID=1479486 RepID=A0A8J3CME2_9PROT|nr:glycosyltransferase family 2 protein [Algimonas arctica]GHA85430.1 hypothetical protein GCM10009069_05720 [Algimonas arctica]
MTEKLSQKPLHVASLSQPPSAHSDPIKAPAPDATPAIKKRVRRDWADDVAVEDLPRISMVVPCFRAAETLPRTLESLKDQKYPNLQIIVIDGHSEDGTIEVLEDYQDMIDYWISEPDKGQVDAINKGFDQADGEIYGWLCADDSLRPGALRRLAREFLRRPDADVVTSGCLRVFDDGTEVRTQPDPKYYDDLFIKNTIEQPSTLWRASLHKSIGPVSNRLRYAFDWELWCKFKAAGAVFTSLPSVTSIYYFSDSNLTSTGGRKIADEMFKIVADYGPHNGKLAKVYMRLYKRYDLKGYYDAENMSMRSKFWFRVSLWLLRKRYGVRNLNLYNWNFASRQERGLTWTTG